jgi:Tfp pilus assembly protein PilO
MIKLIHLLNRKERRIILSVGLVLFFMVLFYFFGVRNQIKTYSRSNEILSSKKAELIRAEDSLTERKKEYMRWIVACRDIEYLSKKYFYRGKQSIHQIRRDLNKLFRETGIQVGDIKYDYAGNKEGIIQKALISFSMTGTYGLIKKFLYKIEMLEKLLYVEKITFEDIERETGKIRLGLSLAVYHEE